MRDAFRCLPTGHREPMKVNVFNFMTGASCQLLPLFPYHDAGAMVPCGAVFTGDPEDSEFGHFFHYNTVQQVAVMNSRCQQRDAAKRSDLRHPTAARGESFCEIPPIPRHSS